jgi:apolipoprotein N-acyltransferase
MRLTTLQRFALVAFSAVLQIFTFPTSGPLPMWRSWLAWFALVPLLVAILARCSGGAVLGWKRATLLGYCCGVLWYAGNCYWIYQTMYLYAGVGKPAALGILVLFSLYLGIYHAVFCLLLHLSAGPGSRLGLALVASPFLWVAVELARAHITSFPWDQLGMSQIDHAGLTLLAPFTGVYGISFVLVMVSARIAAVLLRQRIPIVPGLLVVFVLVVLLLVVSVHKPVEEPAVGSATLLQPNAAEGDDRPWFGDGYQRKTGEFSRLSVDPPLLATDHAAAIIVWPESPSPLIEEDLRFQTAAAELAQQGRSALILGDVAAARSAGRTALYNSASFFTPQGVNAGRYDKIHLVPFGEYIPFQNLLTFARALTANAGMMTAGHDRVMFHTGGHTYGVFICYESIFADEVRLLAKNGADALVNISDDGWYGDTSAPWQHLNMARMRAIENHRWVLRDTNTGVTAAIDPYGRIVTQAPRHVETAIRVPFGYEQQTTFYTRHGDWFAYAVTIAGLALAGFAQFASGAKARGAA